MTSIKVFGKPYAINYVDQVDETDSLGECDVRLCEIKILNTMCDAQKKDTLIHELLHIISEELRLGVSEKQVASLAVGLYSVFRENSINITLEEKQS